MENNNASMRQFGSEHRSDSTNLRDLLKISQDDSNESNIQSDRHHKLGSGFNIENRNVDRIQSSRTLSDIIREDNKESKHSKKTSKSFKDKYIRRQGSGSDWVSSVPVPASDVPLHPQNNFRNITRWDSTRVNTHDQHDGSSLDPPPANSSDQSGAHTGQRSKSFMLQRNATIERPRVRFQGLDDESEDEGEDETDEGEKENDKEADNGGSSEEENREEGGGGGGGDGEAPMMSLMALLAETDKQMGIDGSGYANEDDDDDEEEEGAGEYNNCCVCMVRHKGTAFIPCGHTFCRLCSRELWVQRGNCPLCNNFILEILDIF